MRYLVESSHTKEQCLRALDELLAKGPDLLNRFDFGCGSGVHTGWAVLEGRSESEVRDLLPTTIRDQAHIVEVGKFTPEQIRSFHLRQ